jgi:hypothetical protein
MKKMNRVAAASVAALATAALAIPALASAGDGPGEVVKVKTTVTISAYGYKGFVKAGNSNCVADRKIALVQKGHGVISHATSEDNGRWEANLDELNQKIKIPAKVYAVVKLSTEATAGPIYRCLKATSKTAEINGG